MKDRDRDIAWRMVRAGYGITQIAKVFGVSPEDVGETLRAWNCGTYGKGEWYNVC